ncbi:chemotaxis protein CheC [Metabacillus sp. 84]|uniref:chemotaxis protein CheC n=1 Tax=unclassified Metabacillus TaxID=2675274 RepID=UPI003CF31286
MLTQNQVDALRQMTNMGAANAAASLSRMLGRRMEMDVPDVQAVSFTELAEALGGADKEVACIFLRIAGEISGSMYFIMEVGPAEKFVRELTGIGSLQLSKPPYDEYGVSAVKELGNILIGSYLTSLSDFTGLAFIPEVPQLSVDMFGAVISEGLIELSKASDFAVLLRTVIRDRGDVGNRTLEGHLFLLPDYESIGHYYKALGVSNA